MNQIKNYQKIIEGKKLEDYQQWEELKKKEIAEKEEHILNNLKKYYEYKIGCVESFVSLEAFRTNYLYIIGIILTLIISITVSFGGNMIDSINNVEYTENEIEKAELIKVYQEANMEIMSNCFGLVLSLGVILLLILLFTFMYDCYRKKRLVVEKMYYEDIIRIINVKANTKANTKTNTKTKANTDSD